MDDVVFMVRAHTRADCQAQLDRLCQLLGAQPATLPTNPGGHGWVARAVPRITKAAPGAGVQQTVIE